MTQPPVNADLFGHVIKFTQLIDPDEPSAALGEVSTLVVFCQNFYLQFFQNELQLQITGLNPGNKAKAVRCRLAPRDPPLPAATISLVKWFERLCDIDPDLRASRYDDANSPAVPDFLFNYLPTLLQRALAWAQARQLVALATTIDRAIKAFARGTATLQS